MPHWQWIWLAFCYRRYLLIGAAFVFVYLAWSCVEMPHCGVLLVLFCWLQRASTSFLLLIPTRFQSSGQQRCHVASFPAAWLLFRSVPASRHVELLADTPMLSRARCFAHHCLGRRRRRSHCLRSLHVPAAGTTSLNDSTVHRSLHSISYSSKTQVVAELCTHMGLSNRLRNGGERSEIRPLHPCVAKDS